MTIGLGIGLGITIGGNGAGVGPPSTFTMTQLAAAQRIYQRSFSTGGGQNKGRGTIPVSLNVTAAGAVYARCRSAADGTTILQAPWVAANVPVANGTVSITGVDARLGWFYLDLSGDGVSWQSGTTAVGMGRVIAASGQSLAVRLFGRMDSQTATMASLGVSIDANSSVYATYTDGQRTVSTPGWALPADASNYDSAFTGEFLRREIAASGVNCALVGHSVGATTISTWVPGGANNAQLRVILDAVAGFEAFIWFQGHSDSLAGTSQATYSTSLDALFADVTSRNTVKGASYDKILCPIPNISSSSWGTQAQIDTIRQAQAQWAVSNQAFYSIPMDIDLIDGVHESMLGAVRLGLRFSAAFQRTTVAATSLTPTSVTYATGKTGFGQERTGGYGTLAASFEAINGQTWTFEAVISVASAPASVKVAMGQTNKGWIGVAPDGRLIGNYYNSSSADSFINGTTTAGGGTNPIITDGVRRHVAIVSNPSGAKLFVDGVQVGTSATAPRGQAGNAGFGVGTFNFNPATYAWTGTVDEAAIFATDRYSGAFSPPSAPYSGTETALLSVWHLDGDVTAAMAP